MRLPRRPALLTAVVISVLAGASLAEGGSAGVGKAPAVDGSLTLVDRHCNKTNHLAGVLQTCSFSYVVDPPADTEGQTAAESFVVAWVQAGFTPARGWCVKRFGGPVRFTQGMRMRRKTPGRKQIKAGKAKELRAKLAITDAAGTAAGSVRKRFLMRPGALETIGKNPDSGPVLSSVWQGKSKKPVTLAFGAELSFPENVVPAFSGQAKFRAKTC